MTVEMTSIPRYRRKKSILVGMVAAILADFGGLLQILSDFGGSPLVSGTTTDKERISLAAAKEI